MDCNKGEALRAKEIAERKMQTKDFVGAKKIALKAQQLYPELENISQMIIVCNVHCSSAVKVAGSEFDWYGILQIEPTADEASIKKQYRKLALVLHPDKNKFEGAEAAFKLIGEAQRILTDKAKRSMYDMKRSMSVRTTATRQAPPHMSKNSHADKHPNTQNYVTNIGSSQFAGVNHQQSQAMTFWTMCPFCNLRYQYYQSMLNRSLRCQNCQKPFIAFDVANPATQTGVNSASWWNKCGRFQQKEVPNQTAFRSSHQSTAGNSFSTTGSHGMKMPESVLRPQSNATEGRSKSEREKSSKVNNKRAKNRKRGRKIVEESSESFNTDSTDEEDEVTVQDDLAHQDFDIKTNRYPRRSTRQKQQVHYGDDEINDDGGGGDGDDDDDDDDDFVQPPRSKKLRKGELSCESDQKQRDQGLRDDANKGATTHRVRKGQSETDKKTGNKPGEVGKRGERIKEEDVSDEDVILIAELMNQSNKESMSCMEPEFYDFDKSRTPNHFILDHIWAVYDNNGCMPRYYACIRRVLQSKVDVTWLEANPNPNDQGELNWVKKKLPFACGKFVHGSKGKVNFNSFSYQVSWEKENQTGIYKIYPRKGDIWALFKDWSVGWSSEPGLHREYKFEVVEVISDYDENTGLKVVRLAKLKGFVSLFHRITNKPTDACFIQPNELLRFSHRIPSYKMTGKERKGVPEGSYELDPASLPTDIPEVDFIHLNSFSSVAGNVERMQVQANGSCSKPSIDHEKGKASKDHIEHNNKNVLKSGTTDASSELNGARDQNQKRQGSMNDNLGGFVDNMKWGASMKNDHVDAVDSENIPPGVSAEEDNEYPDSEFHVFEASKTEDKFLAGQIWAIYSDMDGLPKFYAQIKKVCPEDFKVKILWLEVCRPKENENCWLDEKLPVGCGMFRVTRYDETYESTLLFSHLIKAEAVSRYNYCIYPKSGEIWAVYKNLRVDWTEHDLKKCEYEIVRIIQDTGFGLKVKVLKKLGGFNSVFGDSGLEYEVLREDFLRFSHQIPAFQLTEEEGGKLRGHFELDPAAVPPILFCRSSKLII